MSLRCEPVGAGLVPARIAEGNDCHCLNRELFLNQLHHRALLDPGRDKPCPYRFAQSLFFFGHTDAALFLRLVNYLLRNLSGHFIVVVKLHRVGAARLSD